MASTKELLDRLASVPLFRGLSRKEGEAVIRLAREVDHAAGREIVREGERGVAFHLILDGEVSVIQGGVVRRRLGAGDFFGDIALIDDEPRSATVRAETPVRTLSLAAWEFRPVLLEHPDLMYRILVEFCRRLRAAEAERSAPV